jgi:tetratricopeptide (TPR) repeat protein
MKLILNKNNFFEKINFFIFLIGFLSTFFMANVIFQLKITDSDLWLHLKSGEFIVQKKEIPKRDIFSFTKEGAPWIDHEWLFQVVCYLVFKNFSFDGLIFLKNTFFLVSFFILFLGVYDKIRRFLSLGLLFLFVGTTLNRPTLRPDLFSLFFLTLFLTLLYKKRESSLLFVLPFLQLLWTNIHGYFFLGPLIVGIFWIGEVTTKRNVSSKLSIVFILTCITSFLNPYFIKGVLYPFSILKDVISAETTDLFKYIIELKSPFEVKWLSAKFYKAIVLISFLSFFLAFFKKKITQGNLKEYIESKIRLKVDLLLWLIFFIFSMRVIRNIHFFSLVCVYITTDNLLPLLKIYNQIRWKKIPLNLIFVAILCLFSWKIARPRLFNISYILKDKGEIVPKTYIGEKEEVIFPYKEVDFLRKLPKEKRFFNDFNSGAFLIFNAPEGFKVFIDGRTEFYGPSFLKEYRKLCKGDEEVFEKLVKKYKLEGFFISYRGLSLKEELIKLLYRKGWKVIFFGDGAIIFLRNSKENKEYLDKYTINLNKWEPYADNLLDLKLKKVIPYSHLQRLKILNILKLEEPLVKEAKAILKINPANSFAYQVMGEVYLQKKEYQKAYRNLYYAYILNLRSEDIFYLLGKVYIKLERLNEARKILELGLKYHPKSKKILSFLNQLNK